MHFFGVSYTSPPFAMKHMKSETRLWSTVRGERFSANLSVPDRICEHQLIEVVQAPTSSPFSIPRRGKPCHPRPASHLGCYLVSGSNREPDTGAGPEPGGRTRRSGTLVPGALPGVREATPLRSLERRRLSLLQLPLLLPLPPLPGQRRALLSLGLSGGRRSPAGTAAGARRIPAHGARPDTHARSPAELARAGARELTHAHSHTHARRAPGPPPSPPPGRGPARPPSA